VLVVAFWCRLRLAYSRFDRSESRRLSSRCGDIQRSATVVGTAPPLASSLQIRRPARRSLKKRRRRPGMALVYSASGCYWCASCCDALATARAPLGHMYEFIKPTFFLGPDVGRGGAARRSTRAVGVRARSCLDPADSCFGPLALHNSAPVIPHGQSYWLRSTSVGTSARVCSWSQAVRVICSCSRCRRSAYPAPTGVVALVRRLGPTRKTGTASLMHNHFLVPGVRLRRHLRRDLGRRGVGRYGGL